MKYGRVGSGLNFRTDVSIVITDMPHLLIQTNQTLPEEEQADFVAATSRLTAELLGKSEDYVMVTFDPGKTMSFAGTSEPTAFLKLTSLGLTPEPCPDYAAKLCAFVQESLGVSPNRTYIEFSSPSRELFGWNGKTFG